MKENPPRRLPISRLISSCDMNMEPLDTSGEEKEDIKSHAV